jgi:hypothetical protein
MLKLCPRGHKTSIFFMHLSLERPPRKEEEEEERIADR